MPVYAKENQNRIKNFKNKGKDECEMRRRRNEVTIELRKSKRDDQILKRRNVSKSDVNPLGENDNTTNVQFMSVSTINQILSTESSQEKVFAAVQSTRRMLSRERNPPIDDVIEAGIVPKLIHCLTKFDSHDIQFEAAWALTNIASGTSEQTSIVVNSGGLQHFVDMLSSTSQKVSEQAVWAIGNIAGDGPKLRDRVLNEYGVVKPLLTLMQQPGIQSSFLRNITWTISNLCRNKNPPPPFSAVQQLLPALAYLINYNDREVVADTCWALSYLTDGPNEKIQVVIDSNVLPRLISLLGSTELNILTPALRAIGNVVTGTDVQTQKVLELGALQHFSVLLTHKKNSLIKEAAWALSNVTAGNVNQIQTVVEAGLIPLVINVMDQGDYKSQKEAVWVITNYTSGSNDDQMLYLIDSCDAIPSLCKLLTVKEPKVIMVLLDSFNHILKRYQEMNRLDSISQRIEECAGLDKIEELQIHENEQVYQAAQALIERYFQTEEDDLNIAPTSTDDGIGFKFGQPTLPETGFHF